MTHPWIVRWRRWAAHHRVHAGMMFTLLYVAISIPETRGLLLGAILVVLGEGIRVWASAYLEREVRLARSGPYALIRHPLYLGSLFIGIGLAIAVEHPLLWLGGFLLLYVAFYWPAIHVEELRLQSNFGAEYQEYRAEVPGLIPRLTSPPTWPDDAPHRPFSWVRVRDNRELRTVAAMAGLLGVQAVKLLLKLRAAA